VVYGAEVIHHTLWVVGHTLDVVRTEEPLGVSVRHQFDDLFLLAANLFGEYGVAGVHAVGVLGGTFASEHVLHLFLAVKLGVVHSVDFIN